MQQNPLNQPNQPPQIPPTNLYAPTAPGQGWQAQIPTPPPSTPIPGQWQGGPPPQQPRKSRKKLWITLGIIFAVLVVISAISNAAGNSGTSSTAQPTQAATSQQAQSQPTQATTPTPTPKPSFATFGDGTWQVGKDIKPGTYRTRQGSPGCYYARLKGFGGAVNDILANDNTDSPAIVTIAASDKGFQSNNCGTWTKDLSQITNSKTRFDDGMYFVGTDITSGTYKSSGQTGCYYARLAGFSGGLDDTIANNNTDSPAIVTISTSDKGFLSKGCGTWTKM
jgi:hypothetical protein